MVCGNVKQTGDWQKFMICEDVCTEKLLKATVFFQDEVYYRTSDLQDVHSVFGSDLYCHKNCIRNYLIRYDRAKSKCDVPSNSIAKNRFLFYRCLLVIKIIKCGSSEFLCVKMAWQRNIISSVCANQVCQVILIPENFIVTH